MESAFTMCPVCEAMVVEGATECHNCGTPFRLPTETEAHELAPEPPVSGERRESGRERAEYGWEALKEYGAGVPRCRYLVMKLDHWAELQDALNTADAYGWEVFSVYWGDATPLDDRDGHFMVLRRPWRVPHQIDPGAVGC
jgi:hypothetical protein